MAAIESDRFFVCDHPLVQHKMSILRNKDTSSKEFRDLVRELSMLVGYEALRDIELADVEVETPLEVTVGKAIRHDVAIVPILRAGLGMLSGTLALVPTASVGSIDMHRDEVTKKPVVGVSKLPHDLAHKTCLLVDPMLATGGSLNAAIDVMRAAGARDLSILTIISCPEGVAAVLEHDEDVRLYTCSLDRELSDDAFILPGLGDAGDRICGTL